jgi:hypothetical protein
LWSIKWRKERKKSMNVYRSFCLICKKNVLRMIKSK